MMRFSACKVPSSLVSSPGGLNMDPFIPWMKKDKVMIVKGATGTGKSRLSIDLAPRFPAEIASACKEVPSLVSFPGGLNMDPFNPWMKKDKVVIVMGATGTGKSRLSIDLATRFPAEIVNCDKMQVYKGLDIATNKVTEEECQGIPHHLLGIMDPNEDFTALDFKHHASLAVESILRRGRLPIIAGGSNSYIKSLVNDNIEFQSKYDCCFLWVDVSMHVLHSFVSERVNKMVEAGLVDEVRQFFDRGGDYSRGIRRAIGVPELDQFFRNENDVDEATRTRILEAAIEKIKSNNCQLARCQLRNILRLQEQLGWNMHHLDATEAFLKRGTESYEAWERLVARPSTMIVGNFLEEDDFVVSNLPTSPPSSSVIKVGASVLGTTAATATAVAAALTILTLLSYRPIKKSMLTFEYVR